MAENTIILRPCADIDHGYFDVQPETLGHHYLAINEIECDSDATFIHWSTNDSGEGFSDIDATFGFSGEIPDKSFLVTSTTIVLCGKITEEVAGAYAKVEYDVSVGEDTIKIYGGNISENSYDTISVNSEAIATSINNYIKLNKKFPGITIKLIFLGSTGGTYKGSRSIQLYISQVYLKIDYTTGIGIYKKDNGTFKVATAAYKKRGNTWTEITEDECKEMLKNNTIRRG